MASMQIKNTHSKRMLSILRDVFKQKDTYEAMRMLLMGGEGDRCRMWGNSERAEGLAWPSDKRGHEPMVWSSSYSALEI